MAELKNRNPAPDEEAVDKMTLDLIDQPVSLKRLPFESKPRWHMINYGHDPDTMHFSGLVQDHRLFG